MINKPYSYAHIFHKEDSLAFRVLNFQRYAKKYNVRLYRLRPGFAFPELLLKKRYSDHDLMQADGIVVGETASEHQGSFSSTGKHLGFYHFMTSQSSRKEHLLTTDY